MRDYHSCMGVLALALSCYGGVLDSSYRPQRPLGDDKSLPSKGQDFPNSSQEQNVHDAEKVMGANIGGEINAQPAPFVGQQSLPIDDNYGWIYYTDIQLGTPPQQFRAAIDIGWNDMLVPSVHCTEIDCSFHRMYNSSQSNSYQENGTAVSMHYAGFYTRGHASSDVLRIGNLTVDNQGFEEATWLRAVPLWDDILDTVLTLPRLRMYGKQTTLHAVSVFHNIIAQGLLARNVFSIKFSEKETNRTGELLLGGINKELYVEPLETFSISEIYSEDRVAGHYLSSGWQVHAHSITYGPETFPLAGYAAAFSTQNPYINLPLSIGLKIIESLDADILDRIECSRRDSIPDLTIRLGHEGIPFVLKAHDYIRRYPKLEGFEFTEGRPDLCRIEFGLHEEPEGETKFIILGTTFIARWYNVFDYDNKTISLATLS